VGGRDGGRVLPAQPWPPRALPGACGWRIGRPCADGNSAETQGLNVNRGQEIRIRLRPADREGDFLPMEDLVGTMLHELTHIGTAFVHRWPAWADGADRGGNGRSAWPP
jgi:hypothetical protein